MDLIACGLFKEVQYIQFPNWRVSEANKNLVGMMRTHVDLEHVLYKLIMCSYSTVMATELAQHNKALG